MIGQLLVEIWGITCVGAEQLNPINWIDAGAEQVKSNQLDRKCPKNQIQANELTEKNTAVDPRQQQVKDGGGRMVIGQLLMEIWGIN